MSRIGPVATGCHGSYGSSEFKSTTRFRSTIRPVGRTPDGPVARQNVVSMKMSGAELAALDRQRKLRGGMDRSAYLRSLIRQDAARIARPEGTEKP